MELKGFVGEIVDGRIQDLLENRVDESVDEGKQWADEMDALLERLPEAERADAERLINRLAEQTSEEGRFLYAAGVQDGCRIARVLLA